MRDKNQERRRAEGTSVVNTGEPVAIPIVGDAVDFNDAKALVSFAIAIWWRANTYFAGSSPRALVYFAKDGY